MSIKYKWRDGFQPVSPDDLTAQLLSKKQHFIIFDRDGTLVPYADRPDLAVLERWQQALLGTFADRFKERVALVSARGLRCLNKEFDPIKFVLAGNYGLEISFPSGKQFVHPKAQEARPGILEAYERMMEEACSSIIFDYHIYSCAIHFHAVPSDELESVHHMIESFRIRYPNLQFRRNIASYEIFPNVSWNKGDALDQIIRFCDFSIDDSLCIVFGDSQSDEPMFHWVNERQGLSFKVGDNNEGTEASGTVDSPLDVYKLLEHILKLEERRV